MFSLDANHRAVPTSAAAQARVRSRRARADAALRCWDGRAATAVLPDVVRRTDRRGLGAPSLGAGSPITSLTVNRRSDRRTVRLPGRARSTAPIDRCACCHIDLHLEPDLEARTIDGICTTSVEAVDDGVATISLTRSISRSRRLPPGGSRSVRTRGRALTVRFRADACARRGIRFQRTLSRGRTSSRRVLHRSARDQLWTQSQDTDARYWFPCVDYPDNKQTSSTTITVRRGLVRALERRRWSSAAMTAIRRICATAREIPHPTYLFTLVVGEFSEIAQDGAAVPVFFYVPPGREADGHRSFDSKRCFWRTATVADGPRPR